MKNIPRPFVPPKTAVSLATVIIMSNKTLLSFESRSRARSWCVTCGKSTVQGHYRLVRGGHCINRKHDVGGDIQEELTCVPPDSLHPPAPSPTNHKQL